MKTSKKKKKIFQISLLAHYLVDLEEKPSNK